MTDHVESALEHLKCKLGFRCGDMLGKGTYGSVYKVTTPNYDVYAAKIVEQRAVNEMEVVIWPKLKHKNVLKLIRVFNELENVYIFLTDLMATNLFLRLQSRDFKEDPKAIERCRTYARQVLTGISYLHRHKLCHLDLRSENVFLAADDDRAVVADFSGLSWSDNEKKFCPLPHSLRPPEMITSKKRVAPMPIDLWSCGLLIANLFLGKGFYVCTVKHSRAGHIEAVQQYTGMFQCEIYVMKFIGETYSTSPLSYNLIKNFINLVHKFLGMNPKSRLKVDDALAHPFLANNRLKDATGKEAKMAEKPPAELTLPVKEVKDTDISELEEPSQKFDIKVKPGRKNKTIANSANQLKMSSENSKSSAEAKALQTKSVKNGKWSKYKKWWKGIGKINFNSAPILKYIKFKRTAKTKIKIKEGKLKKKRLKANNNEIPETKQLS